MKNKISFEKVFRPSRERGPIVSEHNTESMELYLIHTVFINSKKKAMTRWLRWGGDINKRMRRRRTGSSVLEEVWITNPEGRTGKQNP